MFYSFDFMPYNQKEHATWNQQKKMCKVILINRWKFYFYHCTCQKHFSGKQNLFNIFSVLQQVDINLISLFNEIREKYKMLCQW